MTDLCTSATVVSIKFPDSSCSKTGRMLRCVCWVKAHPVATVTWMFNGSSDLSSSVIPVVKHKGNLTSAEIMLEDKLAEWGPVKCVATNGYTTDTYQMTLLDAESMYQGRRKFLSFISNSYFFRIIPFFLILSFFFFLILSHSLPPMDCFGLCHRISGFEWTDLLMPIQKTEVLFKTKVKLIDMQYYYYSMLL